MGTLEGALQEVFGYNIVHGCKGEIELVCIPEPSSLEELTGHNLRVLLNAHRTQRYKLKLEVSAQMHRS